MKPVKGPDKLEAVGRPSHPDLKVDGLVETLMRDGRAFAEGLDNGRDAHIPSLPVSASPVERATA